MPRYNPPPNWPAPPVGWAPTPGWQPDPAWGPPPPGWPVWIAEPGDGRRANGAAFGRVAVVAGAVLVLVALAQVVLGIFSARNLGAAVGAALLPYLIVSLCAFFTRKRWSWWAIVGAYLGAYLVLGAMSVLGNLSNGV